MCDFTKTFMTLLQEPAEPMWDFYNYSTKIFLDTLIENLPIGIFAKDAQQLKWIVWNKFLEDLIGYSKSETLGKSDYDFFPQEQADFFRAKDEEVIAGKKLVDIPEEFIETVANGTRILHTIKVPIFDNEGNFQYLIGIAEDITERKQFETTLRRRDAILKSVAYTAEQFLKTSNWEMTVNQVLEQLGCSAEVCRAYIFKNYTRADGSLSTSRLYEWVSSEIQLESDNQILQSLNLQNSNSWLIETLGQGKPCYGQKQDFGAFQQEFLTSRNVLSMALVPVFVNGQWWGFIGFDDCLQERQWSSAEIDALEAAASVLGAAISRQQSEEARKTSEEWFRNLVETSSDCVWEVDEHGIYTYISPRFIDILGYEPQEGLGKTFADFMSLEEANRVKNLLATIVTKQFPFNCLESRHIHQAGFEVILETSGVPVFASDGKFRGYRGIARNITNRKQMEDTLRLIQERLELSNCAGNVGVWDWNIEDNRLYIDPILKAQLGYTDLDIPNNFEDWFTLIHPEDRKKVLAATKAHLEGLTPQYEIEHRRLHKDGSIRWVLSRGTAIWNYHNQPYRMTGADTDITDRKQTEEELEHLSLQNELILNSAAEGIIGLDGQGNMTFVNPAAAKMTGYTIAELSGQSLYQTLHHSKQDGTGYVLQDCPIYEMFRDGVVRHVTDEVFWRQDGSSFPVEYVSTPIKEKSAESKNQTRQASNSESEFSTVSPCSIVGAVVTFRDISERLAVERMKDEFVSVVSHELRTPLTSIHGSLGLLLSGKLGQLSQKGQRMLEIAVNNTDRLVRLINDILDLERMELGRVEMSKQICHVTDLITQAAEVMQAMADKAGVTLSVSVVEMQDSALSVWGDSDRLIQVFTNLLSNAIKFSPPETTVWLSAEMQEVGVQVDDQLRESFPSVYSCMNTKQIVFQVKDQGRGIPADKLEVVFGRFQQVDASDSRAKGGTGLGLAICRSIVQQHGGQIRVESTLGVGSTFSVTLPSI